MLGKVRQLKQGRSWRRAFPAIYTQVPDKGARAALRRLSDGLDQASEWQFLVAPLAVGRYELAALVAEPYPPGVGASAHLLTARA
jgi:hypothetical protein